MHPHSFAASLLSILIFKNTSQIKRAKIAVEQKTTSWRSQPASPFSQFPLLLTPKHFAYSFNLTVTNVRVHGGSPSLCLRGSWGIPATGPSRALRGRVGRLRPGRVNVYLVNGGRGGGILA